MKATWELSDACRVDVRLKKPATWAVQINGVEVPSHSERVGWLGSDARFAMPDGSAARVSMRPAPYGPEIELHVGGGVLLAAGAGPLFCRACQGPARATDRACVRCGASLPSREQHIQQRCRKTLLRLILLAGGQWLLLALPYAIIKHRRSGAQTATISDFLSPVLFGAMVPLFFAAGALRFPRFSGVIYAAYWACFFVNVHLGGMPLSMFSVLLELAYAYSMYQTLRVAWHLHAASGT